MVIKYVASWYMYVAINYSYYKQEIKYVFRGKYLANNKVSFTSQHACS